MTKKDKKVIITILIMKLIQTGVYYIGKFTPINPHLLQSNLDNKIPFISYFVYFYISWYLLIIIIPYILYKKEEINYHKYFLAYTISIISTFLIYILYPTTIIRPLIETNTISDKITALIYKIDSPALNCLPSMHCLLCFLHMFYITKCKNMSKIFKLIMIVLEVLIIISTLFIKQHILIDIVSSFIISIIIYAAVEIFFRNRSKKYESDN